MEVGFRTRSRIIDVDFMLLRKPGLSCKLRYKNYALELV